MKSRNESSGKPGSELRAIEAARDHGEEDERERQREEELPGLAQRAEKRPRAEHRDLPDRRHAPTGCGSGSAWPSSRWPVLAQKDVVERRGVELEVLGPERLRVERTHDIDEVVAALEPDREAARVPLDRLAEVSERVDETPALVGVGGDHLHRGPSDLRLQRGRRSLRDDVAVVDDPDPVGEHVGFLQILSGQEDRHVLFPRESGHLGPERVAALWIEAGRRLVEEEDRGTVHEREGEVEPALHPAGVRLHLAAGRLGEADAFEQLAAALPPLGPRQTVQRALEAHVVVPAQEGVERGLLQRGADRLAHLRAVLDHVEAADRGAAARGRQERRQDVHGRRLAGPVGPEEAVDLARRDLEVDPVDGADLLELTDELLCADRGHAQKRSRREAYLREQR